MQVIQYSAKTSWHGRSDPTIQGCGTVAEDQQQTGTLWIVPRTTCQDGEWYNWQQACRHHPTSPGPLTLNGLVLTPPHSRNQQPCRAHCAACAAVTDAITPPVCWLPVEVTGQLLRHVAESDVLTGGCHLLCQHLAEPPPVW